MASAGTHNVTVAGKFGVPSNATAVTVNVTAVNATGDGYLSVYPSGETRPTASNVNFGAGGVATNLVQTAVGANGQITVYASAQTDIVVDLEGYVSPASANDPTGTRYTALTSPARLCDTRAANPSGLSGGNAQCNGPGDVGTRLGALTVKAVQIAGNDTIPADATAAVLNITVVNPAAAGYLSVYPAGSSVPVASNLNYVAGQTITNRVIVPLSSSSSAGSIALFASAATDVVVDAAGYFGARGASGGSQFTPEAAPVRICDTRASNPSNLSGTAAQCNGHAIGPAKTATLNVAGLAGVPAGAKAVVLNVTGVTPSAPTYLTVFPGPARPSTSDLNPAQGDVRANLAVATLSADGTISVYNNTGSVDIVVDVLGWYS